MQATTRSSARSTQPSLDASLPDATPRSIHLLWSILGLAAAVAAIAAYLTYTHYNAGALVCAVGSCQTVQESAYSTVRGVPVALFGLLMYLVIAALTLLRLTGRGPIAADSLTMLSWTVLLAGVLYAGYLTYIELWVIDGICQWCVVSASITLLAFSLESVNVWRATA